VVISAVDHYFSCSYVIHGILYTLTLTSENVDVFLLCRSVVAPSVEERD